MSLTTTEVEEFMRVALIAPNYYPAQSGNAITVRRIASQLKLLGCAAEVFSVDQLTSEQLYDGLKRFRPDLLHAFHGHRGGHVAHALAPELEIPYLITLTGSDVYEALADQRAHDTRNALRGAARLVVFHACVKRRVAEHLPTVEERTVVIPQGVELRPETAPAPSDAGPVFLFPAGVRRVKNLLFPLKPLAELSGRYPGLRLLLVGPVIDAEYAVELLEALESYPFAQYLGGVRHEEMFPLYDSSTVVINCSLFEGGMANSVLEAMAHAKPVLVSDIEGNRSIVKEGANGFLFRDAAEFMKKAEVLLADPGLRERVGRNGRALVHAKLTPEAEGHAYLELYRKILGLGVCRA
jgi:glycosyltransferase involved in cell wall biosynthesis